MKNNFNNLQLQVLQQLVSLVRSASGNILINDETFEIVKQACLTLRKSDNI